MERARSPDPYAGTPLRGWWRRLLFRWLDRRAPHAERHKLHLNNLYILPTRSGIAFVFLAVLIWLLGTNYQNNLILALAYLQMSLMVVAILHTYNNMSGVEVQITGSVSNHAGGPVGFILQLRTPRPAGADNLCLQFEDSSPRAAQLESAMAAKVVLSVPSGERGVLRPKRLSVCSNYPLGLVRCWTWLNLDAQALVYPVPLACPFPLSRSEAEESSSASRTAMSDEINGLRSYQAGDSLKQIAWKHYARDQGLYKKELADYSGSDSWLDWSDFFTGDVEETLSHLSYWVLELTRLQRPFGLSLPGFQLELGEGELHKVRALSSLARFQLSR